MTDIDIMEHALEAAPPGGTGPVGPTRPELLGLLADALQDAGDDLLVWDHSEMDWVPHGEASKEARRNAATFWHYRCPRSAFGPHRPTGRVSFDSHDPNSDVAIIDGSVASYSSWLKTRCADLTLALSHGDTSGVSGHITWRLEHSEENGNRL